METQEGSFTKSPDMAPAYNSSNTTDNPRITNYVSLDNHLKIHVFSLDREVSLEEFHHYVLGIGAISVSVIGIVTNVLSLVVLCRKDMKTSTYVFLIGLAIADITVIVTGTLLSFLSSIVDVDVEILLDDKYLPIVYPLLRPAAYTAIYVSIWITVAVSADRYLAVCHHRMKSTPCCTVTRAKWIVLGIFLCATVYNIPTFFESKVELVFAPQLNRTMAIHRVTEFGLNPIYRQIYNSWLLLSIMWGIPFISLTFMNMRLILAVLHTRRQCRHLGQSPPKGADVTVMLTAIVILFLLCQSPHLVCTMLWALAPYKFNDINYIKFSLVSVLLVLINSSCNFFVYTLYGKRFRRKFRQVLCGCCKSHKDTAASKTSLHSQEQAMVRKACTST